MRCSRNRSLGRVTGTVTLQVHTDDHSVRSPEPQRFPDCHMVTSGYRMRVRTQRCGDCAARAASNVASIRGVHRDVPADGGRAGCRSGCRVPRGQPKRGGGPVRSEIGSALARPCAFPLVSGQVSPARRGIGILPCGHAGASCGRCCGDDGAGSRPTAQGHPGVRSSHPVAGRGRCPRFLAGSLVPANAPPSTLTTFRADRTVCLPRPSQKGPGSPIHGATTTTTAIHARRHPGHAVFPGLSGRRAARPDGIRR